tara:strand:- start:176876 stop:177232 length:357 start_codon:yes stop_codon:yes gene_type:complete
MKLTKDFDSSEFSCNCCGLSNISSKLVKWLQVARDFAGIPFVITSGTRCPVHNKKSGGLASSAHLAGYAVDIAVDNGRERHIILAALIKAGFTRIGISKHFIHVDIDPSKPSPTIWLY